MYGGECALVRRSLRGRARFFEFEAFGFAGQSRAGEMADVIPSIKEEAAEVGLGCLSRFVGRGESSNSSIACIKAIVGMEGNRADRPDKS
jgi:hypothetical protein